MGKGEFERLLSSSIILPNHINQNPERLYIPHHLNPDGARQIFQHHLIHTRTQRQLLELTKCTYPSNIQHRRQQQDPLKQSPQRERQSSHGSRTFEFRRHENNGGTSGDIHA